jgi:hypothetical protein
MSGKNKINGKTTWSGTSGFYPQLQAMGYGIKWIYVCLHGQRVQVVGTSMAEAYMTSPS